MNSYLIPSTNVELIFVCSFELSVFTDIHYLKLTSKLIQISLL